jgi:hypothetical protein
MVIGAMKDVNLHGPANASSELVCVSPAGCISTRCGYPNGGTKQEHRAEHCGGSLYMRLTGKGMPRQQVPCSPGCQGHVSHPCEKCGQQW